MKNKIISTNCINIGKPFEAYKINILSNNRKEFVFLHKRNLKIETTVEVWARYHGVNIPLTKEVTGSQKRKDGLWNIFVMTEGDVE